MSTRLYFSSVAAAPIVPPTPTSWGHTGSQLVFLMRPALDGTSMLNKTVSYDASDHLVDSDAILFQFVSPPLDAQSITNTQGFKLQVKCLENDGGNNLFLSAKVLLLKADGTLDGTLLALTRTSASEFANLTSTNRQMSVSLAGGPTSCQRGGRIVVEVGAGGLPTAASGTQGHNFQMFVGGNSGTDLPEDNTTTAANNPWCQFGTDNLVFLQAPPPRRRAPMFHRQRF